MLLFPALIVLALAALRVRDLLAAVFLLSGYSFLTALLMAHMGAVDVGFTEASVGAGLTGVFFVMAIAHDEQKVSRLMMSRRAVPMVVLSILAGVLFVATAALPPLRQAETPLRTRVEPYYVEHAFEQTGTANIVSAILADYRSFDTFGETTVVFTAGLACYLLLGRREDDVGDEDT